MAWKPVARGRGSPQHFVKHYPYAEGEVTEIRGPWRWDWYWALGIYTHNGYTILEHGHTLTLEEAQRMADWVYVKNEIAAMVARRKADWEAGRRRSGFGKLCIEPHIRMSRPRGR